MRESEAVGGAGSFGQARWELAASAHGLLNAVLRDLLAHEAKHNLPKQQPSSPLLHLSFCPCPCSPPPRHTRLPQRLWQLPHSLNCLNHHQECPGPYQPSTDLIAVSASALQGDLA